MRTYSPVDFSRVLLEGSFWRERLYTVLTRTVPSQYRQLERHGILHSLSIPKPTPPLTIPRNHHNFTTQIFWDSDVGKWIEAASYALSHRRDQAIEAKVQDVTLARRGAYRRRPALPSRRFPARSYSSSDTRTTVSSDSASDRPATSE